MHTHSFHYANHTHSYLGSGKSPAPLSSLLPHHLTYLENLLNLIRYMRYSEENECLKIGSLTSIVTMNVLNVGLLTSIVTIK